MGKGTDKLFVTASEWSLMGGAKKRNAGGEFKRLPISHCALSLQPFETPVCTPEGTVYEAMNIIPWIRKHHSNPVDGSPLEASQLIPLTFHRNSDNQLHCPVTGKVFNDNTHIVAVKPSGHVYCFEAVDRLNARAKHWFDLITDIKFSRSDIITLQDPHSLQKHNFAQFHHIQQGISPPKSSISNSINASGTTSRVLAELKSSTSATTTTSAATTSATTTSATSAYSKGLAAASLTSMAFTPVFRNEAAILSDAEVAILNVSQDATATIRTQLGDISVLLLCTKAPRACYNFVKLASSGYYNNTVFHRCIKRFMVQGGDPTATGKGGESIFGKPFADELKTGLSHSSRGILSMANRGPNTNGSQFFITFNPCPHLDGKHTVFGRVTAGMDVLDRLEAIKTDKDDKPLSQITILQVSIDKDPFQDAIRDIESKDEREAIEKQNKDAQVKLYCYYYHCCIF